MITIFELKHHKCCRCFIRTPFYIKNAFLLLVMSVILFFIYVLYFRKDCQTISSIPKILKGLNSNTFNYLESYKEQLGIQKTLSNFMEEQATPQYIMAQCIRFNKPCKFEGLAKSWPAYEKWKFNETTGYKYLLDAIGDDQVDAYQDVNINYKETSRHESTFKDNTKTKMKYKEFMQKMSTESYVTAIHDSEVMWTTLLEDVIEPSFISTISKLENAHLLQGRLLFSETHYDKKEEVLCTIDGIFSVKLVPHVARQELYAGQYDRTFDEDGNIIEDTSRTFAPNESPVDLFSFEYDLFPLLEEVENRYAVLLREGDCLYIPSYYFHSFMGVETPNTFTGEEPATEKPGAIGVELVYQENSSMLAAFMDAVEKKILK